MEELSPNKKLLVHISAAYSGASPHAYSGASPRAQSFYTPCLFRHQPACGALLLSKCSTQLVVVLIRELFISVLPQLDAQLMCLVPLEHVAYHPHLNIHADLRGTGVEGHNMYLRQGVTHDQARCKKHKAC